jgi:chromosome segregation ATPase
MIGNVTAITPPKPVQITKVSQLVKPDNNKLFAIRIEIMKLSQDLEVKNSSIVQLKSRLTEAKTKLDKVPRLTAAQLQRKAYLEKEVARLSSYNYLMADGRAHLDSLNKELAGLRSIERAYTDQLAVVNSITNQITEKENEFATIFQQRKTLETEAAAIQAQLTPTTAPTTKVIVASAAEQQMANNLASTISTTLKKIDNLANQIVMLENAPDPTSRATLATAKKELETNIATAKYLWGPLLPAERRELITQKLQQSGDFEYFLGVVNSSIKY